MYNENPNGDPGRALQKKQLARDWNAAEDDATIWDKMIFFPLVVLVYIDRVKKKGVNAIFFFISLPN